MFMVFFINGNSKYMNNFRQFNIILINENYSILTIFFKFINIYIYILL